MSNRKAVTMSLDADLWRHFKAACALLGCEASTMVESFFATWLRKNEARIIEMTSIDNDGVGQ